MFVDFPSSPTQMLCNIIAFHILIKYMMHSFHRSSIDSAKILINTEITVLWTEKYLFVRQHQTSSVISVYYTLGVQLLTNVTEIEMEVGPGDIQRAQYSVCYSNELIIMYVSPYTRARHLIICKPFLAYEFLE